MEGNIELEDQDNQNGDYPTYNSTMAGFKDHNSLN